MMELDRPDLLAVPREKMPLIVVLEDIRSGLNIGSVFRSADAFQVQEIILSGYSVIPPHREILKTALDATLSVPWSHTPDLAQKLIELKSMGYTIGAVEQVHGSISLDELNISASFPAVLIFGNEVHGVSDVSLGMCDFAVEVPQSGIKHSLNIAVCAGIILWHCYHQYNLSK